MRITRHIFEWVALVAGLLVFASCREVAEPVAPAGDEVEFTIVAGAPGTRTTNQGLSTLWAEGDALSVIHSAAGSDEYYASRFDYVGGSANNVFRGRVRHLSASNDWYLIYPYSSANVSPEAVRITVPAGQTQVGNSSTAHLAGESFPLVVSARAVAESEQLEVTMNNVLTVFRYDLTNKTDAPIVVKSVELTAPVALVGDFEGDITGDTFTWAATQATG